MGRRQYLCGSPNPTTFAPYPPSLLQQTAHHLVEQIRPSIGCSNKAIRLARKHCHAIYFCQRKNRYPRTAKSPCKDCLRTRTNFFRPHRHECETLRGIITGSRRYPPRTKRTPNSSFRWFHQPGFTWMPFPSGRNCGWWNYRRWGIGEYLYEILHR